MTHETTTTGVSSFGPGSNATGGEVLTRLRDAIDRTVGSVFYGTLLKTMRNSPLKGTIGHGGRGEDVFQGQLDQMLVEHAGTARSYDLNEAMFNHFANAAEAYPRTIRQNES